MWAGAKCRHTTILKIEKADFIYAPQNFSHEKIRSIPIEPKIYYLRRSIAMNKKKSFSAMRRALSLVLLTALLTSLFTAGYPNAVNDGEITGEDFTTAGDGFAGDGESFIDIEETFVDTGEDFADISSFIGLEEGFEESINTVSYIGIVNSRLDAYEEKLLTYAKIAYKEGNPELSKEITSALDELTEEDKYLYAQLKELQTEALPVVSSTLRSSLSADDYEQAKAAFVAKAFELEALETKYIDAIADYAAIFTDDTYPPPEEGEDILEQEYEYESVPISLLDELEELDETDEVPVFSNRSAVGVLDESKRNIALEQTLGTSQATAAAATPSITILAKTATSVTFNVTFPVSGQWGNTMTYDDHNVAQPYLYYNTSPRFGYYMTNGTYTFSGLTPGGFYYLKMMWAINSNSYAGPNTRYFGVQLPYSTTENIVRTDGTYVYSLVESADKALTSTSYFNTWMNRLDQSYIALQSLTGYTPYSGAKIGIQSVREIPTGSYVSGQNYWQTVYAYAGNPAVFYRPFYRSLIQRLSAGDWSRTAIHELSHDFDKYAWEFDAEVLADLKSYYVVETLGAKVYPADTEVYYTGSAFANFFRTDHRMWCYANNFNYGNYTSYGMTWLMINIKNQIGWQPFKDTFRYFSSLTSAPTSAIGKFNLFMTKLKDYSGYDVLTKLTANDKAVIGNRLGGTVAYVPPITATPIYLNTAQDINSTTAKVFSFTPSTTVQYSVTTSAYAMGATSCDTYLELYSDATLNNRIAYNDDGGGNLFSQLTYTLNAGTTYYIKLRHYNNSSQIYARIRVTYAAYAQDGYEANNLPSAATSISSNALITSANLNTMSDVDYFKFTLSAESNVTISLSNIPSGCDYDLKIYDSANVQKGTSTYGGNASEYISLTLSTGTYYIKVYSYSGASSSYYSLAVTSSAAAKTITVSLNPSIPEHNGVSATARVIKSLPIAIYSVNSSGTMSANPLASGFTNNQGTFTASITIPSSAQSLSVRVTFDNSILRVQDITNDTIFAFDYNNIPITTSNTLSYSRVGTISGNELVAYAIWSNVLDGLAAYDYTASGSPFSKLTFKCRYEYKIGSACNGISYIRLNGEIDDADYLDKSVIFHEMGHWKMIQLNAFPIIPANDGHNFVAASSKPLAYTEGWASYFASMLLNSQYYFDYASDGYYLGADLLNARYDQYGGVWTNLALDSSYGKNQEYEVNIGTVLWRLQNNNSIAYTSLQSYLLPTKEEMQEYYDYTISNTSAVNRKAVWATFNNRACAFDTTLPYNLLLSQASGIATLSASDDISIEKVEWYVNGILRGTAYPSNSYSSNNVSVSSSFNIQQYLPTVGPSIVEARVYDSEGIASNLASRPRSARYANIVAAAQSNSSVQSSFSTQETSLSQGQLTAAIEMETPSASELLTSIRASENIVVQSDGEVLSGETESFEIEASGFEDIYLHMNQTGVLSGIQVYTPDGILYDEIDYIAIDESYRVANAAPGIWTFKFIPLSDTEMTEIMLQSGISQSEISADKIQSSQRALFNVVLTTQPSPIAIDDEIYTSDPMKLFELIGIENGVTVREDGDQVNIAEPLAEGSHDLTVTRLIGNGESEETHTRIIVDTIAPTITYLTESFETTLSGILLAAEFSDDNWIEIYLNGNPYYLTDSSDIAEFYYLEVGSTEVTIELMDAAGNSTTDTVVLTRLP